MSRPLYSWHNHENTEAKTTNERIKQRNKQQSNKFNAHEF